MNLTNIKKSIKNIFLWHLTIRWAILLITTGLFVLILYPSLFMTQPSYNLGDIASRNIKAPRDFFIEDEMATEIHRQQEIENVPTVYDHDTALLSHRRSQVHQAFESIRSVWKKMENNPNSDILDGQNGIQTEATKPNEPLHDRIWSEKAVFIKQIGIPVSDGAYRILEEERFSDEISATIQDILNQILKNGVVAHKEILLKEAERGIVLRDLETKTEKMIHVLKQFYGLDQAKAMVRIVGEAALNDMSYNLRNLVVDFTQELIQPNITLNRSETSDRRKKAATQVTPVVSQIKAGEMVLREGERITPKKLLKIQVLQQQNRSRQLLISGGGAAILMLSLMLALYTFHHYSQPVNPDRNRDIFCLASIFLTIMLIARLAPAISDTLVTSLPYNFSPLSIYFNAPLAAGAMTVCLLIGLNVAVSFALVIAMAVAFIFQNRLEILIFFFISGTLAAYWVKDCRERT
ncbi:MAG: HD family phosphohydrolase, partial [Thermodesulfobacteriota bacterium]|nr:HD family phosphohydrolase [Thermodesulfobacteriota bacterium]